MFALAVHSTIMKGRMVDICSAKEIFHRRLYAYLHPLQAPACLLRDAFLYKILLSSINIRCPNTMFCGTIPIEALI
jgi:hypothetical protein